MKKLIPDTQERNKHNGKHLRFEFLIDNKTIVRED